MGDQAAQGNGSGSLTIRPATIEDLDEIIDVQRAAGRGTTTRFRDRTAEAIADGLRHVVVARLGDGDRCVGWAATQFFAEPDGPAPAGHYLMGVTVEPEHRRAGIARALIAARIAWIRERDDTVSYLANASNTASLAAHHDWPFEEIARGPVFHGITFTGGVGVLLTARFEGSSHDATPLNETSAKGDERGRMSRGHPADQIAADAAPPHPPQSRRGRHDGPRAEPTQPTR